MNLAILIILTVIGTFIGFIYENYSKFKDKKEFTKANKKHIIYFLISGVFLIILDCVLDIRYSNRLIDNIRLLIMLIILVPVAAIDYKKKIIENKVILISLGIRVIMLIAEFILDSRQAVINLKSMGLGFVLVLLMAIIGIFIIKNGFGMGDIKLMFIMILYLGFASSFSAIFMSLVLSMIASIYLLVKKEKSKKDTIPFAPFILLGTYVSVILTGM